MNKLLKFPVFLMLFFVLFSGCKTSEKMESSSKFIEQYFRYFNNHDFKSMAEMYVENASFKDPSLGKGIVKQSRAQTIKKYTELQQVFPDLKDKVLSVYPSGEKNIIVEFISSGTAADGTSFELPICTIFTIENNLITHDYTYYDNFEE